MSTRKSTNKQNAETAARATTPDSSTPTLRSKQNQDTGSETSEAPTTPTSRDSGQWFSSESKRTRRTNFTQSQSTPKRATPDAAESPANETSEKTASKNTVTKDKETKDKSESAKNTEDDSPGRRKRRVFEKRPTMATRKSAAGSPAIKNSPVRTSLRAAARNNANQAKSPPKKVVRKRKADAVAPTDSITSTPIKRERADSDKSEQIDEEEPTPKRIKMEKEEIDEEVEDRGEDEEEPEEEILMEIRTDMPTEVKVKQELIEMTSQEAKVTDVSDSISENPSEEKTLDKDSKTGKDLYEADNTEKSSTTDSSEAKSESVTKRQSRRKTIETNTQQEKRVKRVAKQEPAKSDTPQGKRRGRKPAWLIEEEKAKEAKEALGKNAPTKTNPAKADDEKEKSKTSDFSKTTDVKDDVSNVQPPIADTTKLEASDADSSQLPDKSEEIKADVPEEDSSAPANPPLIEDCKKTEPNKKTDEEVAELTKLESESEPTKTSTPSVPETVTPARTKSPSSPRVPENIVPDDDQYSSESEQLIFTTTTAAAVNGSTDDTKDERQEPLTIDTTTQNSDEKESIASTVCTAGSEKSASLSPIDLQSEELSAVSVKEFSKEPEFLANNLGIEMDPKLGEIVQSAVVEKTEDKIEIGDEKLNEVKSEVDSEMTTDEVEPATELSKCPDRLSQSPKPSDSDSAKSPALVKDEEEDAELNGSDLLKEGEVLMLEESTEEESGLSQKIEEDCPAPGPDCSQAKESPEEKVNNDKAKVEPAEIKKEEVEDTDDSTNPNPDPKEKELSENTQSSMKSMEDTTSASGDDVAKETELLSEDLIDHDDDELGKRATTPNECSAMEIDSGVSDVAENNSNDPNEDLNLIQEIMKHEIPKKEEDEDAVEDKKTVLPEEKKIDVSDSKDVAIKEQTQDTKENKENIQSLKLIIPKNDTPAVERKEVAPMIIRKIPETPETLKQKEKHFKFLGLLTLKAADEAKIEKQKRRQQCGSSSKKHNGNASSSDLLDTGRGGNGTDSQKTSQEYTGTLKTVIKLNRPMSTAGPTQMYDGKKKNNSHGSSSNSGGSANSQNGGDSSGGHNSMALVSATGRHSLKMTFQKGRGRGGGGAGSGSGSFERNANNGTSSHHSSEETYYTIQNEGETATQESVTTHGRKSHHYRSNTDQGAAVEAAGGDKKEVVIPEKASSFGIHPGRLCQDQCYYCGGKFGLYDTPCHVAQFKSLERQKKILDNEEKLTVDNCLCDACFRHVDRRANAAQKKRLLAPGNSEGSRDGMGGTAQTVNASDGDQDAASIAPHHPSHKTVCFVANCGQRASHTFRRKGLRKTIRKLLGHESDMANSGGRLPICDKHYEVITPCLECALCKRRLVRNQMHHISQDIQLLESLLIKKGLPIKFQANPAVCKLCKYFTNLLLKPPEGKTQKAQFVKNYRSRLLQFHNVDESEEESEAEDQEAAANKIAAAPPPAKRGRKPKNLQTLAGNQKNATATSRTSSSVPVSSEDGSSSSDVIEIDCNDSTGHANTSGQMQLDNDVMVDYDVPVLSEPPSPTVGAATVGQQKSAGAQQQPSKLQTILQGGNVSRNNDDISMALRSNPNISMRELLPGEEEMGLQVNVPFGGSSSQRTPEGWTRIQTFLQYDEPTRRLWEDLQKPYGNQSSFLRHLILLEKYFRNGDLILSQSASTTAVAYSETVQNRLRSFDYRLPPSTTVVSRKSSTASSSASSNDNVNNSNKQQPQQQLQASGSGNLSISGSANTSQEGCGPTVSKDGDTIKKLQNKLTITLTPKSKLMPPETMQASRSAPMASTSGNSTATTSTNNSILKTNLLSRKNSAIEIIAIGGGGNNDTTIPRPSPSMFAPTKQQKLLAAANQLSTSTQPSRSSNLPPELISINRNNPNSLLISSRNNPMHSIASMKNKLHSINPLLQRHQSTSSLSATSSARPLKIPPTIVKLPTTLSTHERLHSRNWRPSLIPIQSGPPARSAPGVLYQTVDGRKLPSLVQVQSGGKPFLISIHDYNRMCLLRREKLLRDQMMKGGGSGSGGSGGPSGSGGVGGPSGSGGPSGNGAINSNNSANSLLKGALSSSVGGRPSGGMMPHGKQW